VAVSNGPTYPIESVDRALTLILAFEDTNSITITEASRLLGVSRSTAYRLLTVLEHRGFVNQNARTKVFHGGPALLRVGVAVTARSDLRNRLRPTLESIVSELDETAHLVVLQGTEVFFLDCVEGSRVIRATSRVGTSLPAHVTSGGKVLLAELPESHLDALLGSKALPRLTKKSTVSAASLRRELAKVRRQGWASNDGESEVGVRAVAVLAPAKLNSGDVDAAIAVAAPAQRVEKDQLEAIAAVIQRHIDATLDLGPDGD
jgi:DNA-binding IclR family transcriptional regulator